MDGEKLLLYDCGSNKVIPMNPPREEGKAMDSCNEALGTLTDVGNELKSLLTDIKQEKYAGGGKCEKPRAEVSRLWGQLYGLHSFKQKTGCWAFFPRSPAERSGEQGGVRRVQERWTPGGAKHLSRPEADVFPMGTAGQLLSPCRSG